MKRSEMVGAVSDTLLQFLPNTEKRTRDLIADVLMFEIERNGMLPPYEDGDEPWGYNEGNIKPPKWED